MRGLFRAHLRLVVEGGQDRDGDEADRIASSLPLNSVESGSRPLRSRTLVPWPLARHTAQAAASVAGWHKALPLGDQQRIAVAGRAGLTVLTWLESIPVCSHTPGLGQDDAVLQGGIGTKRA